MAVRSRADKLVRMTTIPFQSRRMGSFPIMVSAKKTHNRCTQKTGSEDWPSITSGLIAKNLKTD